MLPTGSIFINPIDIPYLAGDSTGRTNLLEDYELGGIILNDPTSGRENQIWKCWYENNNIYFNNQANETPIQYLTGLTGVTEISFTFDTSMQPILVYVQDGVTKLRYYNISVFTTITVVDAISPVLCYDDKRNFVTSTSDAQLFYIRASNIYYRQQRDNYSIEYLFASDVPSGRILNVGRNYANRLQLTYKKDVGTPIPAKTIKAELYSKIDKSLVGTKIVEIVSCQAACSPFGANTWSGQYDTIWSTDGFTNPSNQVHIKSNYVLAPATSRIIEVTLVIEDKTDQPFNNLFWLPNSQQTIWYEDSYYTAVACQPEDANVYLISRDVLTPSDDFTFNITIERTDLPGDIPNGSLKVCWNIGSSTQDILDIKWSLASSQETDINIKWAIGTTAQSDLNIKWDIQ